MGAAGHNREERQTVAAPAEASEPDLKQKEGEKRDRI